MGLNRRYRLAAELRAHHRLKTPDALHLATAQSHGCTEIWTNDNRLNSTAGVSVHLPLCKRGIEGDLSNKISPNPSHSTASGQAFPKRGTDRLPAGSRAVNLFASIRQDMPL